MLDYNINISDRWQECGSAKYRSNNTACINDMQDMYNASGFYGYVKIEHGEIFATVDHIRSIPLYYSTPGDGVFYLSDNSDWIANKIPDGSSSVSHIEYKLTGYVSGRNTRHPKIKQLLPGESIYCRDGKYNISQHFRFEYGDQRQRSIPEVIEAASSAVNRLVDYADGRQIILLFSGGLDSRIIASLLVKKGYENLIAITYGKPESREVRIAQKRANALGLNWHHIKYNHKIWQKWYHSTNQKNLYSQNSNLASIPHIEMGPALAKLKSSQWVSKDPILVPGHSGDMIAGSHIPVEFIQSNQISQEDIIEKIIDNHYQLNEIPEEFEEGLRNRLKKQLDIPDHLSSKEACEIYERWDVYNRQAKFIVNSLRTIESAGFKWYIPLWDRQYTNFWLNTSLDQRLNQKIYREAVVDLWTSLTGESKLDALETERSVSRNIFIDLVRKTVRGTAFQPVAQVCYQQLQSIIRLLNSEEDQDTLYNNHPLGWYGIVPQSSFEEVQTDNHNINTFIAMDILGEIALGESINKSKIQDHNDPNGEENV